MAALQSATDESLGCGSAVAARHAAAVAAAAVTQRTRDEVQIAAWCTTVARSRL